MNYAEFCKKHGIRLITEWTDSNPFADDSVPMNHWRCTLRCAGRQITLVFSMGMAHGGPPSTGQILETLVMDASGADQDFEEWASDLGYDIDSRRAERIYRGVVGQTAELRNLLGEGAFEEAQRLEDE